MQRLMRHFAHGTQQTVTGGRIGCEVETIFVFADTGQPISLAVSRAIRAEVNGRPRGCRLMIDLSRATMELAIGPCRSFSQLMELKARSLVWLYGAAERYGAVPVFAPTIKWDGPLVDVSSDPRDQAWLNLDGRIALEHLVCASEQLTVDVHPHDAVAIINQLWKAGIHGLDYAANDRCWRNYIATSTAGYAPTRYAGPMAFEEGIGDIAGYVGELCLHDVVMHEGQEVRLDPAAHASYDIDLFLRSVWWHYRLRRYGDSLALGLRPFARRDDAKIERLWSSHLATIFGR